MAPKKSLFQRMKAKPHGDWAIGDVETVCRQAGLDVLPPSSGSHYKAFSSRIDGILSIPAARPIKAVYIRKLVGLIEAHMAAAR